MHEMVDYTHGRYLSYAALMLGNNICCYGKKLYL